MNQVEVLAAATEAVAEARKATAQRCIEIAMERARLFNGDASAMCQRGRHEMAAAAEMKADQFEWMARAM